MTIDLYYTVGSAPCRAVLLVANVIGIELNLIPLDILNNEHLTNTFLKINPQHTIPTLDDNGFVIWESRAIITYLQNRYGKDDSLYPSDPKERAMVDQKLYFDMDLYNREHQVYNQYTVSNASAEPEKIENLNKALEVLNSFLEKSEYVNGNHLTLADLSLVVQISNLEVLKHNLTPFKDISRWYTKLQATVPGYHKANDLSVMRQMMNNFFNSK